MKNIITTALLFCSLTSYSQQTKLPAGTEPTPTGTEHRLKALQLKKQTEAQSLVSALRFENVGPTIMSGRIVDMAINENDPTEFYVAYASGGVWYTNNNGTSFTPIFDEAPYVNVGALDVDFTKTPHTIYVGAGEANSSRSSYTGLGMYKSVDGGKTWKNTGLNDAHHIARVIISASQPNVVFAAVMGHLYSPNTERGLYKSVDGGESWKRVLFANDQTGVIDAWQDPKQPDVWYAASWQRNRKAWNFEEGGNGTGLYKSINHGENWELISNAASGLPIGPGAGRMGISGSAQNSNLLYVVIDNQQIRQQQPGKSKSSLKPAQLRKMSKEEFLKLDDKELQQFLKAYRFPKEHTVQSVKADIRANRYAPAALADFVSDANDDLFSAPIIGAEVYRSEDAGKTWKKTNSQSFDAMYYTYGYYFGRIWVSPIDDSEVYIGGVTMQRSTDAGKSFSIIDGPSVHADHHCLWINPKRKGHLINGNDGGINITWDFGKHWMKCNSPAVGQFYAINADNASPYNIYGGLQDNGVWVGPHNYVASEEWHAEGQYPYKRLLGGDGMQIMIDPRDANIVYTGYQFGYYYRINRSNGEEALVKPSMKLGDARLRFNWQAPIWLSVHNPDILYFGSQFVHRSMNRGDNYEKISGDLTRGGRVGDVPYGTISTLHESPLKFGLLYTGSDDGLIHVSKDGGNSWTRISDGLPQHLRVNRVIASGHVESRVYAVLSGFQWDHFNAYIYCSEDYGKTWQRIDNGLPMEPVNVIKEDPTNPNLLFVGTDGGLYTTINRGKTWMRMTNNLPPVAVHDVVIQAREKHLLVGTHGRSIYKADISALQQLTDSVAASELAIFDAQQLSTRRAWTDDGMQWETRGSLAYFSKSSQPVTVEILSEQDGSAWITFKDTAVVGLNYVNINGVADSSSSESYIAYLKNSKDPSLVDQYNVTSKNPVLVPGEYYLRISVGERKSQRKLYVKK